MEQLIQELKEHLIEELNLEEVSKFPLSVKPVTRTRLPFAFSTQENRFRFMRR